MLPAETGLVCKWQVKRWLPLLLVSSCVLVGVVCWSSSFDVFPLTSTLSTSRGRVGQKWEGLGSVSRQSQGRPSLPRRKLNLRMT